MEVGSKFCEAEQGRQMEWSDLPKSLAGALVRYCLSYDGPVLGSVATDAQMGQLMGDDTVTH